MQNRREMHLNQLSHSRNQGNCWTLHHLWSLHWLCWKTQTCLCWKCYYYDTLRDIWTRLFFLVKILAWVLGDLSSKPDVPQHVGERVSKSLNYSVPYFCLQTVSNIHPILCLLRAPQSLTKNLLSSIHIKGLKQMEALAVHQWWMQRPGILIHIQMLTNQESILHLQTAP